MRAILIRRLWFVATGSLSLVCWTADTLSAQSGNTRRDNRGFVWVESFQGTSDATGTVTKLDSAVGYRFGSHFELDAGVPLYFLRASSSIAAQGTGSANGIGDAYLDLQLIFEGSNANFISSITGAAPTGDSAKGLSTGRATFDWSNNLEFTAGPVTPYVTLGLANSIADTRFFTRPFTSLGTVAHFDGGADFQIWRAVSIGASAYADAPFGQQKIFSKLVKRGQTVPSSPGNGRGRKKGVFETQSETIGGADIARDNGGSAWLGFSWGKAFDFQLGYSRSVEYDLNSVFFSVVFRMSDLISRRPRH